MASVTKAVSSVSELGDHTISDAELLALEGIDSNIQDQIDNHEHEGADIKSTGQTVGKVLTSDGANGSTWGTIGGGGDMTKTAYDSNDDGKVNAADVADAAPWTGITGKPSTFPPDTHNHAGVYDPAGTASAAIATHVGLSDPHSQYLTAAEGDAAYDAIGGAAAAQATANAALPKAGGTMSGNIAMGGAKITGAGAPTAGGDLVNKTYADGLIAGGVADDLTTTETNTALRLAPDGAGGVGWASTSGSGTVTSVDIDGGTTGLTASGGPITGAGTITLGGTLAEANGGTGGSDLEAQVAAKGFEHTDNKDTAGGYVGIDGSGFIDATLIDTESITEAQLTLDDNTTANATLSRHGLQRKLSGNAAQFMNGVGSYVAVSGADLTAATVTDTQLATDSVIEAKIQNGAVTINKIGSGAVDNGKLASGAVTNAKVAAAELYSSKFYFDGDVSANGKKITSLEAVGISGLTGAVAGFRFAGMTTIGAPTTGTFSTNDVVVSAAGAMWICTSGGSPGTWIPFRTPLRTIDEASATTRTLALLDWGAVIEFGSSSAIAFTFPQDSDVSIPVGAYGEIFTYGTGQITFAAGTGATLRAKDGTKTQGQYSSAAWRKRATNTFVITGQLGTT